MAKNDVPKSVRCSFCGKAQENVRKIHADHLVKTREKLNKFLSERTGQTVETIQKDTERDNYMTAEEALKYGLIDGIMDKRK